MGKTESRSERGRDEELTEVCSKPQEVETRVRASLSKVVELPSIVSRAVALPVGLRPRVAGGGRSLRSRRGGSGNGRPGARRVELRPERRDGEPRRNFP